MTIRQFSAVAICFAAIIFSSSCKKWLDVNKNPNVASDVPVDMLLSSAEIAAGSAIGTDFKVNGSLWAQYWTQNTSSSQYKIYEQYSPSANDYDYRWRLVYSSALMDLQTMEEKARTDNAKDYVAVAQILKAYLFQVATDAWGDIPFSEALKGRAEDGGIVNPKYDAQETVYNGINNLLDSARNTLDNLTAFNIQGDLIFNGDGDLWRKFCNTLQLKVYLRLTERAPAVAQAGVEKVYNAAGNESGFLATGEVAKIDYNSTPGNQNPLYSEMFGLGQVQNVVASSTVVDSMNANNDYRAYALFTILSAGVVGIPQGAYNLPPSTPVSIPTAYTGARAQDGNSATAAVRFMTDYESLFLQAEAAARYPAITNGADDEALFYEGITASFDALDPMLVDVGAAPGEGLFVYLNGDTANNIPPAYWGQYPSGGTLSDKIRHIITQKWFAMTGTQGFEAWTEQRRTGFPDFFKVSANSLIGNRFPERFLYPSVELTANQNFPGQKFIYDKVWWDVH